MSQAELAAAMSDRGFSWHQATVSQVEAGRPLRFTEAVALGEVLRIPLIEWLALDPEVFSGNVERARAEAELRALEQQAEQQRADLAQTEKRLADLKANEARIARIEDLVAEIDRQHDERND